MSAIEERAAWQAARDAQIPTPGFYSVAVRRREMIREAASPVVPGIRGRRRVSGQKLLWSAEWTLPRQIDSGVIVYVRGAVVAGSVRSYRRLTGSLSVASECRVLALDYRRPPEHAYPAPLDDLLSAMTWLEKRGFPMSQTILAGDSFGGTPILAATIHRRNAGRPMPAGLYMLCPKVDYSDTPERDLVNGNPRLCPGPQGLWGYFRDVPADDPRASPGLENLEGLPPVLIQESTGDNAAILAGARVFRDDLLAAENACTYQEWETVPHIWPYYGDAFTASAEAMTAAGTWIRERLS